MPTSSSTGSDVPGRRTLRPPPLTPARIAILYAVVSVLWIAFSDRALGRLVRDHVLLTELQTLKGWGFVLCTAGLLFFVVRAAVADARRSAAALVRSEAALQERDAMFRAVFDAAGVGVVICALDRQVLRTNPFFDAMLGYERGELVGRPAEVFWDLDDPVSNIEARQGRLDALLAGLPSYTIERRYIRKDGRSIPVHLTASLVHGADGTPLYDVAIVQDLTERREVEAALSDSEERLRQAQKMEAVGRLAGGVAHDFNNLLTVIISNADLALDALGDLGPARPGANDAERAAALSAAREDVAELRQAAERAAAVTQQLLAFSRKQALQPTTLDLNEVVTGIGKLVRRLVGDDVRTELALSPSLGTVHADRGRLEQVVMNLVLNARDAMPDGGVLTLSTATSEIGPESTVRSGMQPGRYATLAVRDTGVGMSDATRARLFEPFFTTKPLGQGTGLGLSTVYGIVKQSGGYVYADSAPGEGSTFTVYLPESAPEAEAGHAGARPPRADADAGATVLVVDDEPAVREATRRLLERNGFVVRVAADGQEALTLWESDPGAVDLVLTDLAMPGMDGRELARRLRGHDRDARVLCMSGFAGPDDADAGDLLQKPFTAAELLGRVRAALGA